MGPEREVRTEKVAPVSVHWEGDGFTCYLERYPGLSESYGSL